MIQLQPYPTYKNSGVPWLGEIPAHWEVHSNRALFKERNLRNYPDEPLLSVTIKRGVVKQSDLLGNSSKKDSSNEDKSSYKLVCINDIPYNKMRMWQGATGASNFRGIVSPAYVVLSPQINVYSWYYHYLLRTPLYARESHRYSYGICDDQLSLRFKDFKVISSPIPPYDEQKKMVLYLQSQEQQINKFIRNKRRLIALLKEQKQNVVNQAVTRGINPDVKLKPSGVEWIGDIPEHWTTVTIKRIAQSIQTGPFGSQLHAHDYVENEIPVINPKHIKGGVIIPDSSCTVNVATKERLLQYKLCTGDLVMARRGELGRCAIVGNNEDGWLCGTGSIRLRLKTGYYIDRFLFYVISSKGIATVMSMDSVGATMDNLNATIVGNLVVPLLSIEEQMHIVDFIHKQHELIDLTISRTEREIELIREYRTRLISDVVTGKVDVRNIEVETVAEEELIEEVEDREEQMSEEENIVEEVV